MSVQVPTVDLDAIKTASTTGLRKALFGKLRAAYTDAVEYFEVLSATRKARENAEELFNTSTDEAHVQAREVIAQGLDHIENLQAQIEQVQKDIESLKSEHIAAIANSAGADQEELDVYSDLYKRAVSDFKDFGTGAKPVFPEVSGIKFPGVTQVVTGKGGLRAASGVKRFSCTVTYNGKEFASISPAAQASKVDAALITSQLINELGSEELAVGQTVTVTITDNGEAKVFTITGKVAAKRGRKPGSKNAQSDTSEPTDAELAEIDSDDDDDDDEDENDLEF